MNNDIESSAIPQSHVDWVLSDRPLPFDADLTSPEAVDEKTVEDCRNWLSFHRVWGQLPVAVLQAIAESFHPFRVEPQTLIYQEGQTPIGLYLLQWGTVEIFRRSSVGQSLIRYRNAGDLFGYTLVVNAVEGVYQTNAIALNASEIWFLPKLAFHRLIREFPSIQQKIQSLLSQDLHEYMARIS